VLPDEISAMLDGLLAAAPVGLALVNRDLRYVRVNPALATINGVSVEACLGRRVCEVVPALADVVEPLLRRVLQSGETLVNAEVRGETAAAPGRQRQWTASYFPVRDAAGTIVAAGVAVTEVTERYAEKEALRRSEERFRALVQQSSDVVVVLDGQGVMRYVSPSARRIFGYEAEEVVGQSAFAFVHPDDLPRLMQSFGGVVQRPGGYLPIEFRMRNVEDILDASRIIAGKLSLASERVDLCIVVEAAAAIVRPTAEARSIELRVACNACPVFVLGDATRLQQVVWNLLANAIKFTPLRGSVALTLAQDGTDALLSVRDTGQGIAPEFLPHVFERYRQADPTAPRQTGLGLGLALVRQLVQMHHGSVTASSPGRDQGASFTVRLPLLETAVTAPGSESQTSADGPDDDGRLVGLAVLVVEDDRPTRELLALVLGAQGASVVTVDSAEAALEALARVQPAVLLADIGLPGMDGYELLAAARRHPAGRDLPAVALTAYAGDEDRDRALAAGYAAHLAKPLDPDALVSALAALTHPDG